MWYEFELSIPAGTTEAAPVELELPVGYGVIHKVVIEGAPGMHRLAYLRIKEGLHQIYPSNPERAFQLDAVPRIFEERHEMFTEPYTLTAIGYAPDTTYAHTYHIAIGVLPPESFPEFSKRMSGLDRFLWLVGIRP